MNNKRVENVIRYYVLCNKLKDVVRSGWKNWHVKRSRVESVAEHVFGTQALAIAMYSEYEYDIDISKVIYMLAVHELEEIIIGDLTWLDIKENEKLEQGHQAIEKILDGMLRKEEIKSLILEFDEGKTEEAKFAYYCDKFECDLQCKLYDEENTVEMKNEENCKFLNAEKVKSIIDSGVDSWSKMWLEFDKDKFKEDSNFTEILNYIKDNNIGI